MKFKTEDIDFDKISPREFENLCYDLLVKYNFRNLIWREGGADNGRDIEAKLTFSTMLNIKETKWFFECKHYTSGGVPPNDLNSKIVWADAEQPDYLVLFLSSYLTNGARTWIEKIIPQKYYEITVIEGEDLKNRLIKYPELVERYFSLDRYEKLFKDVRDYQTKFNIKPSYEFLTEIISNIDFTRLSTDDISFILFNFYDQYASFEGRNEHHGDFDGTEINRVLDYLIGTITNTELKTFKQYYDDYDILEGTGFLDEMERLDDEDYSSDMKKYNFQRYYLHLNHKKEQDKWKIGEYLVVNYNGIGFELFKIDKTEIRIVKDRKESIIHEVSLNISKKIIDDYDRYFSGVGGLTDATLE